MANLLVYPSLVESPFIIVKIGSYTFGNCKTQVQAGKYTIQYPNFLNSLSVKKVNGSINTYVIQMVYQITSGDDPNFMDKVFSSIGYGKIKISYGDWASPTFIYKEEEALITDVQQSIDFANSKINYTISCTGTTLPIKANNYNFPARTAQPSQVILELITKKSYGIQELFPGMSNLTTVKSHNFIATDDKTVYINAKNNTNIVDYINYLVSCMIPNADTGDDTIKSANYYMCIKDDQFNEVGGTYFIVTKVKSNTAFLNSPDVYEVDIGYPDNNFVTSFTINDSFAYSLLYSYSQKVGSSNYVYRIDDNGNMITEESPNITSSNPYFLTTPSDKTWWTQMTSFPIKATLTVKGLLRPSMLMSYVRIRSTFFGKKYATASGLYIITAQEDRVNGAGYKTTLSLTRIGADTI